MDPLWGHVVGSSHCKNKQTNKQTGVIVLQVTVQPGSYTQTSPKGWLEPNILSDTAENGERTWKCLFCFWHLGNVLFCLKAPRAFRVSWRDRGTGRDTSLHWCHHCDTRAGLGASTALSVRVSQAPGTPLTAQQGHTEPSTSQESKTCLKKTQDNNSKLWNSAPACSYEEAGGFLCSSTSLYFIKRNLLSILDWSYRKLLINSLPQKGSSLNPK